VVNRREEAFVGSLCLAVWSDFSTFQLLEKVMLDVIKIVGRASLFIQLHA
tara:strand:+ start:612 stop:761 length:150 start_codon:yes stop_codon:yes gene_type:complete